MNSKSELFEISEFNDEGYKKVVDYASWRVAMLNYIDELLPENIDNFQKHDETDEVFILLQGECILFFYDNEDNKVIGVNMEPNKIYNVKKGTYHTHTLSEEAKVLIVENRDTCDDNSPSIDVTKELREEICNWVKRLWP